MEYSWFGSLNKSIKQQRQKCIYGIVLKPSKGILHNSAGFILMKFYIAKKYYKMVYTFLSMACISMSFRHKAGVTAQMFIDHTIVFYFLCQDITTKYRVTQMKENCKT